MRYFKINFKYLSTTWKEDFVTVSSETFPDEDNMEDILLKKYSWADKISVTEIKEISYEKYHKYFIHNFNNIDE